MSLYSPHQQVEPKTNSIYIINPTVKEFITTYFNDKNQAIAVVMAPLETREFDYATGNIVLTHLANFVLHESGFAYKSDVKEELAKIKQKCIVYE